MRGCREVREIYSEYCSRYGRDTICHCIIIVMLTCIKIMYKDYVHNKVKEAIIIMISIIVLVKLLLLTVLVTYCPFTSHYPINFIYSLKK